MAEIEHDTGFQSIGEVLNLLLEEFPDVTISKIRFLESQGLISPERTSSGYRKFYQEDIDLLRVILTEQRQNFLPLRVIRNRLETGEIDPTGEHLGFSDSDLPPETPTDGIDRPGEMPRPAGAADEDGDAGGPEGWLSLAPDPGGQQAADQTLAPPPSPDESGSIAIDSPIAPGAVVSEPEFRRLSGLSEEELQQLVEFGILHPTSGSGRPKYDAAALRIAKPAGEFLRQGIDARHLRLWRTGAEREASLFEQLVQPRFRQRNPEASAQAVDQLRTLDRLGAQLRAAMMSQILARHFE